MSRRAAAKLVANTAKGAQGNILPESVNEQTRAQTALHLRILGYQYDDIARQCGYADASGPWKAIKKLRNKQRQWTEDQQTAASVQATRIETAILTVMLAIQDWQPKDKLWAVDRLGPLLKRQAELLGLDAPKQEAQARQMVAVRITSETANALRGVDVLTAEAAAALPDAAMLSEWQEGVAE